MNRRTLKSEKLLSSSPSRKSALIFGLLETFTIFEIFPGIFSICPFPISWPINSTYAEQSRKGPRYSQDSSRKDGKPLGLETPGLASLNINSLKSDTKLVGEGVKSARGEIAIPRRADHTRNMFGTSLDTTYCK